VVPVQTLDTARERLSAMSTPEIPSAATASKAPGGSLPHEVLMIKAGTNIFDMVPHRNCYKVLSDGTVVVKDWEIYGQK
jgi:hypothetical protein